MAVLITVVPFGAAPVYVAAAAEMEYPNDGKTLLHVNVSGGSPINATHVEQTQCPYEHTLTDVVDACPAGAEIRIWRGHQIRRFNNPSHRSVVRFSVTTGVTVAAVSYA